MELYNKYRPNSFEDVIGNEETIKSIRSELQNGSHVFLLSGQGGCGKTTLARIMAKEVGASDLDVHEINSSENRGIDTAREIIDIMKYPPSLDSKAVVFILDECHKWTNDMQNAMLKPTEEVPEHVYFFLCTTDPQKLIAPLKTRCSKYTVESLSEEQLFKVVKSIARQEDVKVSPDVCKRISTLANGSARDAIKILSSVIYLETNEERMNALSKKGVAENEDVIELARSLFKGEDWSVIAQHLTKCKNDIDSNPESVRQLIMSYANSVLLKGYKKNAEAMIQAFSNTDTYRNGKYAITVGCLDCLGLINS